MLAVAVWVLGLADGARADVVEGEVPCRVTTTLPTLGGAFFVDAYPLVATVVFRDAEPHGLVTVLDRRLEDSTKRVLVRPGERARLAYRDPVEVERVTPRGVIDDLFADVEGARDVEFVVSERALEVRVDGIRTAWIEVDSDLGPEASFGCPARATLSPLEEPATTPAWLWGSDPARDDDALVFRRTVETTAPVRHAELVVSVDNLWSVTIDGEPVVRGSEWTQPSWTDVTEWFAEPGEVELLVQAENEGGPAAFAARLTLHGDDGSREVIATDASWEVAPSADGPWRPARVLGALGDGPWTAVTPATFDAAARARAPQPPEASSLTVPDGFVVERLAVAAPHQGSWVSLCVDDRGRLITSDQRGAGLFRITPGDGASDTAVEPIPVPMSGAQGLCWFRDALYVVSHGASNVTPGLHRVRDTDGDDVLDTVELLRELRGAGEHGWHAVVPEPGRDTLLVVAGNDCVVPTPDSSRVPLHWDEDQPLPRVYDPSGFMAEMRAPGGAIWRIDADATHWELISTGYRNTYDVAFDARGEAFTFDADMEWDLGTPWYRPTRVCRVTSGSEYGWRTGSGKWPVRWPDGLPGVVDVGPGSPVGITFTHGAAFPESHRDVLLLGDWSYGRVQAVRFDGGGGASVEPFLSGRPFPVTDLVVNPSDGALYITTGGRDVPSGLYRVQATGMPDERTVANVPTPDVVKRRALERYHGAPVSGSLDHAWPNLAHPDRFVRFAARIALEWQPLDAWRARALAEPDVDARLAALLALVRAGTGDAALADDVYASLAEIDVTALSVPQYVALLRIEVLADGRLAAPDDARRAALVARHAPSFPHGDPGLDADLCARLVALGDPTLVPRALDRVDAAVTVETRLALLMSLRLHALGWTDALRERYFAALGAQRGVGGGASHGGYVDAIRDDALDTFASDEPDRWRAVYDAARPADAPIGIDASLADRPLTDWTVDDVVAAFDARAEPDVDAGRRHFAAVGCAACHRVDGFGGAVGPDLTAAGRRFSARDVVEAIVHPSRTVSDLYTPTIVVLRDGDVVVGQVSNLVGERIDMITDMTRPGRVTSLKRGDIVEMRRSTTSPMPDGLLAPLTADETADLVAYVLAER